jgi:hypothetical protein
MKVQTSILCEQGASVNLHPLQLIMKFIPFCKCITRWLASEATNNPKNTSTVVLWCWGSVGGVAPGTSTESPLAQSVEASVNWQQRNL